MTVQIGMIPIILRDEMAADYWGTLLKIAEIGYQGIESWPGNLRQNGSIRRPERTYWARRCVVAWRTFSAPFQWHAMLYLTKREI